MTETTRGRRRAGFTRPELERLGAFYGVIVALHVAGWGLFLYYGHRGGPVYAGAGALAYSFGLRHAFDADHISAVDDTTRYLMQRGKKPLGVGFFFSLGHSTVVVALAVVISAAAQTVQRHLPAVQRVGATVGGLVAGTFRPKGANTFRRAKKRLRSQTEFARPAPNPRQAFAQANFPEKP